MQLKNNSKKLSWITVLLLLQKSPYLPLAKSLTVKFSILAEKVWTWKMIIPTTFSSASWHALSGATTYVTTSDSNPSSGNEGDDFSFSFYNHGYKAFSYKVENLPDGLTFNNNINGPKITGTLPSAGTYTIDITGYRYSALSGNSTPTYNLILNVSEKQVTSTDHTNNNSTNTNNNEAVQNNIRIHFGLIQTQPTLELAGIPPLGLEIFMEIPEVGHTTSTMDGFIYMEMTKAIYGYLMKL